ncbi:hypothetical protein AVEN_157790-1, partial [Araneus ventricosus]
GSLVESGFEPGALWPRSRGHKTRPLQPRSQGLNTRPLRPRSRGLNTRPLRPFKFERKSASEIFFFLVSTTFGN